MSISDSNDTSGHTDSKWRIITNSTMLRRFRAGCLIDYSATDIGHQGSGSVNDARRAILPQARAKLGAHSDEVKSAPISAATLSRVGGWLPPVTIAFRVQTGNRPWFQRLKRRDPTETLRTL